MHTNTAHSIFLDINSNINTFFEPEIKYGFCDKIPTFRISHILPVAFWNTLQ